MREIHFRNLDLGEGRPKIAVPLTGTSHEEIVRQAEAAKALPCQILEWRVDHYLEGWEDLEESIENETVHLEIIRILDDIDYEIEYEALDYEKGKKDFIEFLKLHNILEKTPVSKSKRAFNSLKK